jgi:hypothetical protein
MLEEQRRLLAASGGTEADFFQVGVLRGGVLARSGNAGDALKVFVDVAANPLSGVDEWQSATPLALATGQMETYRKLCRSGVLRFASTAQGKTALAIAFGLLHGPADEITLSLAPGMVERVAGASDWSREWASLVESILALREHRPAEALALLDKYFGEAKSGVSRVVAETSPAVQACDLFVRAQLSAELGRADDARRDFAKGRAALKLAIGDKPGHDRGEDWRRSASYDAESWQREAQAAFKAKGISLPEPEAK